MNNSIKIPFIEKCILRFLINHNHPNSLLGDFEEMYCEVRKESGFIVARFWLWIQIFLTIPTFFSNSFYWSFAMIGNYIKIGLRNIKKNKIYSFINISGLAVGMACFIMIILWVQDELSYDVFHNNVDRLYRVLNYEKYSNGEEVHFSQCPAPLSQLMKDKYPEVDIITRYANGREVSVEYKDKLLNERGFAFADAEFLELFNFPLIKGNPESVLSDPFSVIITQELAQKYFGTDDPIGKTIKINNKFDFQVSGIFENLPSNTHFDFNFLIPFTTLKHFERELDNWRAWAYYVYLTIKENVDPNELNSKMTNLYKERDQESLATCSIQSIKDVHLYSSGYWGIGGKGDIRYVYIFSFIAFFILLTACINFMNLSTAKSANRLKEVGIRKVIGAARKELINQFLSESLLLTFISLVFSILIVYLTLPLFNEISSKAIEFNFFENSEIIYVIVGTALFTGLISGSYPALFLSAFQPAKVLKSGTGFSAKGSLFRKTLVTIQFVLTITLIISAVSVNKQIRYMREQNLGFEKEHVLAINLKGDLNEKFDFLKTQLIMIPNVKSITTTSRLPAKINISSIITEWEGSKPDEQFLSHLLSADYDFVNTYNIQITDGRYFSKDFISDTSEGIVVNNAAVKMMGFDDPIGKKVREHKIVGVVEDFNFESLHKDISPLIIFFDKEDFKVLSVKVDSRNIDETIKDLQTKWSEIVLGYPFDYQFVDEVIEHQYRADLRIEKIINVFTVLIIFIACLGLLGLASFTAEQRRKEIGVRKVLGASLTSIIINLSKEYTRWVLAANIIAWPIAYLLMENFLQNYAYKIKLELWIFFASGIITFLIAITTVLYQSVKAVFSNPIDSIRAE